MTAPAAMLEVMQYTAQYELLRAQVVGTVSEMAPGHETRPPRGIGLALLLREGMPGWLKAVTHVLSAALAQTKHGTSPRVRHVHATSPAAGASALALEAHEHPAFGTMLPAVQRHDVTILLASLVLSTRRLAGLSPREGDSPCR